MAYRIIHRDTNGVDNLGPELRLDQLIELARQGEITPDTWIRDTDRISEKQAYEMPSLRSLFESPSEPESLELTEIPTEISLEALRMGYRMPPVYEEKPIKAFVPPPSVVFSSGDKKCPFCAETIKAEAIICRFCNHDLRIPPTPNPLNPLPVSARAMDIPAPAKPKNLSTFQGFLVFTGCIIAGIWFLSAVDLTGRPSSSTQAQSSPYDYTTTTPAYPTYPTYPADSGSTVTTVTAAEPELPRDFKLDADYVKFLDSGRYGSPVFAGKVVNHTGFTLTYAKAECEFLDKKGNMIATGYDNTTDTIAHGDSWRFEITVPDTPGIRSARMTNIRGSR